MGGRSLAELNGIDSPSSNKSNSENLKTQIEQWFERYANELRRFIFRNHSERDEIDDLLHDVFVVALRKQNDYSEHGKAKAYLYKIAKNIILASRRKRRLVESDQVESVPQKKSIDATARVERDEECRRLKRCLHDISPQQRIVIELRTDKGLSFKEISKALDIALNTAISHFHRGIARLKEIEKEC